MESINQPSLGYSVRMIENPGEPYFVELATISWDWGTKSHTCYGASYTRGGVTGYVKRVPEEHRFGLFTFEGDFMFVELRLVSVYKQRAPGYASYTLMHCWQGVINGVKYAGRNSGEGMLLRLRPTAMTHRPRGVK